MGAFYCIVKLPVDSAEDFSKFLLTDFEDRGQTVMFAPGRSFTPLPNLGKIKFGWLLCWKPINLNVLLKF